MEIKELQDFKDRKIKAKKIFHIREIDKVTCYNFVRQYHYLGEARFFCVYGYGLYYKGDEGDVCVGVATYSNPNGALALKGWFGLENSDQTVLELSRLCMLPCLNGTNATSFLLGNSMKMLVKHGIKAIITLADASRHIGSIYQVCNFKYYGLTDAKTDFYDAENGKTRSDTKVRRGVWVNRTRKHRYCYLLDKSLKVLYAEQPHPTQKAQVPLDCCGGTKRIYDPRFGDWYSCPICCGYLQREGDSRKVVIQKKKYKQLSLF